MYILLTAATAFEIDPIFDYLEKNEFRVGEKEVGIQVTGIGSMMTTYELTKAAIQLRPDYIIQAGIAGSFEASLVPPQVVLIKDEIMGDLGAAEKDGFSDIFDLKLMDTSAFPFANKRLINPLLEGKTDHYKLPVVSGLTINEVSTNKTRIQLLKEKYGAQVESMEGVALHYIALKNKIPFLQIRAISNEVGVRDKQQWKIKEAIKALNDTLIRILPQL
jgi:futalosine hydrolase